MEQTNYSNTWEKKTKKASLSLNDQRIEKTGSLVLHGSISGWTHIPAFFVPSLVKTIVCVPTELQFRLHWKARDEHRLHIPQNIARGS